MDHTLMHPWACLVRKSVQSPRKPSVSHSEFTFGWWGANFDIAGTPTWRRRPNAASRGNPQRCGQGTLQHPSAPETLGSSSKVTPAWDGEDNLMTPAMSKPWCTRGFTLGSPLGSSDVAVVVP